MDLIDDSFGDGTGVEGIRAMSCDGGQGAGEVCPTDNFAFFKYFAFRRENGGPVGVREDVVS